MLSKTEYIRDTAPHSKVGFAMTTWVVWTNTQNDVVLVSLLLFFLAPIAKVVGVSVCFFKLCSICSSYSFCLILTILGTHDLCANMQKTGTCFQNYDFTTFGKLFLNFTFS